MMAEANNIRRMSISYDPDAWVLLRGYDHVNHIVTWIASRKVQNTLHEETTTDVIVSINVLTKAVDIINNCGLYTSQLDVVRDSTTIQHVLLDLALMEIDERARADARFESVCSSWMRPYGCKLKNDPYSEHENHAESSSNG